MNYTALDLLKEMQTFTAVDLSKLKQAGSERNLKINTGNNSKLKSLKEDWASDIYDEDPDTLVYELISTLK
jgi:hypothetical protein